MSVNVTSVLMPGYLKEWFITRTGGWEPVRLTKASVEYKFLFLYLQRKPEAWKEQEFSNDFQEVEIVVPDLKMKNTSVFNWLSPAAERSFLNILRAQFDVSLFKEVHSFSNAGAKIEDLITAWMESRGIEMSETNFLAVKKRYDRLRIQYNDRKRKNKKKS